METKQIIEKTEANSRRDRFMGISLARHLDACPQH